MGDEISNTLDKYLDKKYIPHSIYNKCKKLEVNDWLKYEK